MAASGFRPICYAIALSLCACSLPQPDEAVFDPPAAPFIFARTPPPGEPLRAADESGFEAASDAAERFASAIEASRGEGRAFSRVAPEASPLLHLSPEGRAFVAASGPRALALGDPAEQCPARALGEGATRREADEAALAVCERELAAAGAQADCGCRLIASGAALLGAQSDFAYAPGVSARIISREARLNLDLAATEEGLANGARRLLLRPGGGELRIRPDGEAALAFRDELWTGRRFAEGLSRGRYRERFALTRADGARMIVAVGWEPVAFAAERLALTRWPEG